MWSTVFIIFIYLLAYLSCPLFIKGWFIILQKRLRANKCESFPTVCQRFFYTGISSNSGETIYSIWKKYLYPQYWISVNPLLYLFFYCQCISVFMIFSAKEEEDNLSSRRASAQAVTSKWQLRTTSPMNTNSSAGENGFSAKNGS